MHGEREGSTACFGVWVTGGAGSVCSLSEPVSHRMRVHFRASVPRICVFVLPSVPPFGSFVLGFEIVKGESST